MAIFTKCILAPHVLEDGVRISVMRRHTLSDGTTTDLRIAACYFHYHLPHFAPSPLLLGDYYKRGLTWDDFAQRYYAEQCAPSMRVFVRRLAWYAAHTDVTLLCIEESPHFCHRQLLSLLCRYEIPTLHVEHR